MKIIISCLILVASVSTSAQNLKKIDSIAIILKTDITENERVDLYVLLASQYLEVDSDSVIQYASKALHLARSTNYAKGEVDALVQLAWQHLEMGEYEKSESYHQTALEISKRISYLDGIADAYNGLGKLRSFVGDYEEALNYYQETIIIFESTKDSSSTAGTLIEIGNLFFYQGDLDKALDNYMTAVNYSEKLKDNLRLARSYQGIGIIYGSRGNYLGALEYFLKSLKEYETLDLRSPMGSMYGNIGLVYEYQDELEKALEYYNRSLEIQEDLGNKKAVSMTLMNIGQIYNKSGDYEKALTLHLESLKMKKELGDREGLAQSYLYLGKNFLALENYKQALENLFMSKQIFEELESKPASTPVLIAIGTTCHRMNRNQLAKKYLEGGIELAKQIGSKSDIADAAEQLSNVNRDIQNFKEAYEAQVLFKQMTDSLKNEENTQKITRLQAEYDFQKEKDLIEYTNQQQRQQLESEIEQQSLYQRVMIIGLVVALLFIVSVIYINRRLKALNKQVTTQRDELEKLYKTKTRFFSIVSHDLRGPMHVMLGFNELLKSGMDEDFSKKYPELYEIGNHLKEAADQVGHLMDSLLSWAMKEEGVVPYRPSNLNIKECFEENSQVLIPQARTKNINLKTQVEEELEAWLDKNTFQTILRNLTGNAIKFTENGGEILLTARSSNGHIQIKVCDRGTGIPDDKLQNLFEIDEDKVESGTQGEKGTGLGLNLVNDFVRLNKGTITVDSKLGHGTTFTMNFPVSRK